MHELSIALEICRVIEERLPPPQLPQLVELGLDIGEQSELELPNLTFCLDALLSHPPFAGATVVITRGAGDDMRVSYMEIDDERPTH